MKLRGFATFGWWLLIVVVLLCFTAMVYFVFLTRPKPADSANCRLDGIVPAHTVVLIDQSDPFTRTDTDWTWHLVMDEARTLPKNGRLTVFPIETETPGDVQAVFTRCSPGSPSSANPLYENPTEIRIDWENRFERELSNQLNMVMANKHAETSPLMEQIAGIVSRYDFASAKSGRRLILVSDMMQNSANYSFYRSGVSYEAFLRAGQRPPDLHGISVGIFVARRDSGPSEAALLKFWQRYFREAGAKEFQVLR